MKLMIYFITHSDSPHLQSYRFCTSHSLHKSCYLPNFYIKSRSDGSPKEPLGLLGSEFLLAIW